MGNVFDIDEDMFGFDKSKKALQFDVPESVIKDITRVLRFKE